MLRLGTHKNKQNVYPGNIIYNSAIFSYPNLPKLNRENTTLKKGPNVP